MINNINNRIHRLNFLIDRDSIRLVLRDYENGKQKKILERTTMTMEYLFLRAIIMSLQEIMPVTAIIMGYQYP